MITKAEAEEVAQEVWDIQGNMEDGWALVEDYPWADEEDADLILQALERIAEAHGEHREDL